MNSALAIEAVEADEIARLGASGMDMMVGVPGLPTPLPLPGGEMFWLRFGVLRLAQL